MQQTVKVTIGIQATETFWEIPSILQNKISELDTNISEVEVSDAVGFNRETDSINYIATMQTTPEMVSDSNFHIMIKGLELGPKYRIVSVDSCE
jgi:hypothetical protein